MDYRRTSVMPSGYGQQASGLPVPSTLRKPTNTGRMSMSGPAMRGPLLPPPSTVQRNSVLRTQNTNINPLLMSASKPGAAFGRTPMHNSVRRGSMWGGPGSQGSAPSGSQPMKDPRNLRDAAFRSKMRQEIVGWLQTTGLDIPNSVLQNITGKDFGAIFKHLVSLLDPNWPFRDDQRWEEQFMPPLKALRYPFVGAIDPRWLATPAAQHSWPTLLGVLHWLVQMGKSRLHYMESEHPTLQDPSLVPEEFDDEHHHQALAMNHYLAAYEVFLKGQDVYPDQEKEMEDRYALKDAKVVADLEDKQKQLKAVQSELKRLHEAPAPIEVLKQLNKQLKHDRARFEEFIRVMEGKKDHLISENRKIKAEIEHLLVEIDRNKGEEASLAEVVKAQNLSPDEVRRMNTEHDGLSRELHNLKHKIEETSNTVHRLEVSLSKKVADAEEAVELYDQLLLNLGLLPPLPPPWEDVDLRLVLQTSAPHPSQMLQGADIQNVIKTTLNDIAAVKQKERSTVDTECNEVDNEVERLGTQWENMQDEMLVILKNINSINDKAEGIREASHKATAASRKEETMLEENLVVQRKAALESGAGVKSRLQAMEIAYREQIDKTERLRDETVRAIIKNSTDIVAFKEQISNQLKELKDFAESN